MTTVFRFFIAFVALSFIPSCAARREIVPVVPFERPVTPEALMRQSFFGNIDTLSSEADVRVYRNGKKLAGLSGVLVYRSPDSLRLRILDPFGFIIFDLLADSGYLQAYIPYNDTIFEGEIHIFDVPDDARYRIEEKDAGHVLYVLRGPHDTPFRTYGFDGILRNVSISGRGNKVNADVVFDEFSGRLPTFMKIQLSNGFAADIRLDDPEVDRQLRDEIFMPINRNGKKILPFQKLYEMKYLD